MKRILYLTIIFVMCFSFPITTFGSTTFEGGLSGRYSIDVDMGNNTANVPGYVSGSWSAVMEDNGSITAHTLGEFGGINGTIGLSGSFNLDYNPETNTLQGTWSLPGSTFYDVINFNYNPDTNEFVSHISGVLPSENGGYPFNGEVYLSLSGVPNSVWGTIEGQLQDLIVHWEIQELDASGDVEDMDGTLSGTWEANLLETGEITGSASGEFYGTVTAQVDISSFVNLPFGINLSSLGIPTTISIDFPYRGTWQGTIGGSFPEDIFFAGCWVEDIRHGQGIQAIQNTNLPQGIHIPEGINTPMLGGGMNLNVDISQGNFPYPFSGKISGGGSFVFDITEKLQPFLSTVPSQYSSFISNIPTSITIRWEVENCAVEGHIDINN